MVMADNFGKSTPHALLSSPLSNETAESTAHCTEYPKKAP